MSIAAAILAAGASTRLGQPKQLVFLGNERLLDRALRIARDAGCDPVVVILGAHQDQIRSCCDLVSATVITNDAWPSGMASSIHAAVCSLPLSVEGLLLMACDQPAATPQHLRSLMSRSTDHPETYPALAVPVGSFYAGRVGIPAYFPASCFQQLLQLQGDQGARALLQDARCVDLQQGELDIDTLADLDHARQQLVP